MSEANMSFFLNGDNFYKPKNDMNNTWRTF